MSRSHAVQAGWQRGLIEFRQSLTNGSDLFGLLFWPVAMLVVLLFIDDVSFGTSGFLLGTLFLPSVIGMNVALNGLLNMSQLLAVEREDGTLLRAKAIPNGMVGYLIGKIISVAGTTLISLLIVLIPGLLMVDGLAIGSAGAWLNLAWVVVLGMVATLPIGAILGSLAASPRSLGMVSMLMLVMVAISGVFYPLSGMPGWLQVIAQIFPIYWLGLGVRSAMLPDAAVAVEIGESWRIVETIAVLGAWSVLGLVVAPIVLRRMARRESGSKVVERRELALMHRVG